MTEECTVDWKCIPEKRNASDGMLITLMFGGGRNFQNIRVRWFRRCNASGTWMWPGQMAWRGVINIVHGSPDSSITGGSFRIAWLTEDQYLVQKLKGNI